MEIAKANIVRSEAGRDKGKLFFVLDVDGEYLLLADGKERKAESPKRKKRRHARLGPGGLCEKIRSEERVTNRELREALAAFRGEQDPSQEG